MDRFLVQTLGILGTLGLPGVFAATAILGAAWNAFGALSSSLVHKEG